jgi:AraC-like DNA-binding protein
MKSIKIIPSNPLKPYIEHFWWIEAAENTLPFCEERVLADGAFEIIFHFGEAVVRILGHNILEKEPTHLLIGQTLKPYTILSSNKVAMLGIKFFPHTALMFFDFPVSEMKDKYSDLSNFWGSQTRFLHEKLDETLDLRIRIDILERFLISILLKTKRSLDPLVANTILKMQVLKSGFSIKNVCSNNGISRRHLEKKFVTHVGLSPKTLFRIMQFQDTLFDLKTKPNSLTHIGLDNGYYDQSHFIRNFKEFADCTPSQFIKEVFPLQNALLQPI